jgi:hypothetical protein
MDWDTIRQVARASRSKLGGVFSEIISQNMNIVAGTPRPVFKADWQ